MKILVFGLPGSGKSTLVQRSDLHQLKLDLGNLYFKSDKERLDFTNKMVRFTNGLSQLPGSFILDSYPQYFNPADLSEVKDLRVWFLLPRDVTEVNVLVDRVKDRDGINSSFYSLYSKKAVSWWKDWQRLYITWKHILGSRVILKSIYENEVFVSNGGDSHA